MSVIEALLLGIVQGVTEFLPVSSSAHLVLARDFLSMDTANALAFDGVLHLATSLAVLVYFRGDIWTLLQAMLRKLGRLPVNEKDLTNLYALLLGTIPAVLIGMILEPYLSESFQNVGLVAMLLFFSAVLLMYAEWRCYNRPLYEPLVAKRGFLIGIFQVLALLPGFSRLGSAMAGGMILGMSRFEATRFSLLLSLPVTLGFGTRKLLELIVAEGAVDWVPIIIGGATAGIIALIVIHAFLNYVKKYTLWPFIWYSVILSALLGYVSFIS